MKWASLFFHKIGDFIIYNLLSVKFWFTLGWMWIAYKTANIYAIVIAGILTFLILFLRDYQKPDNNLYKTVHDWLSKA